MGLYHLSMIWLRERRCILLSYESLSSWLFQGRTFTSKSWCRASQREPSSAREGRPSHKFRKRPAPEWRCPRPMTFTLVSLWALVKATAAQIYTSCRDPKLWENCFFFLTSTLVFSSLYVCCFYHDKNLQRLSWTVFET